MDVTAGVHLADGTQAARRHRHRRPLALLRLRRCGRPGHRHAGVRRAARRHGSPGVPEAILSDNGKVFTNRFGQGTGLVLFDRICRENGISHLLTAPCSPTTTGKVERFHKTMKREFLGGQIFDSIDVAQEQLDVWVHGYNSEREHQSLGNRPPAQRFALARRGRSHFCASGYIADGSFADTRYRGHHKSNLDYRASTSRSSDTLSAVSLPGSA